MECSYCKKEIYGMTGFQEARAFEKHLPKCRKNPSNIVLRDGRRYVIAPKKQTLLDALNIRAASGQ